jgi:TRAP-type C4-dicarboxylate transport system substrate-binding protein
VVAGRIRYAKESLMFRIRSLALGALLGLATISPAAPLKIATLSPDGTSWMTRMRAASAALEQRTAGRVQLRFYPGGVMGDDATVLRKLRVGQLHGGAVTIGALTDLFPDVAVYSLPFLFRDLEEVAYVRRHLDPVLTAGLAERGLVAVGFAGGGFARLLSREPIRTLAEGRQRKIWSPPGDAISETAFSALGVTPITLPLTDVLTGLQTGLVDTVASPPVAAIAMQWHTQVRFLLDLPLTYIYGTLVFSDRALQRLSAADRAALQEVLARAFREMDAENRQEDASARAALQAQGITFINPPAGQRREWERTVETAVARLGSNGYFSPGLVARVQQLVQTYRTR